MANNKFEQALSALDPGKRALLKRIVAAAAFAVPTISSFAVRDLASGQPSCTTTVTTATTIIGTVTVFKTMTTFLTTTTVTGTRIVTTTTTAPF